MKERDNLLSFIASDLHVNTRAPCTSWEGFHSSISSITLCPGCFQAPSWFSFKRWHAGQIQKLPSRWAQGHLCRRSATLHARSSLRLSKGWIIWSSCCCCCLKPQPERTVNFTEAKAQYWIQSFKGSDKPVWQWFLGCRSMLAQSCIDRKASCLGGGVDLYPASIISALHSHQTVVYLDLFFLISGRRDSGRNLKWKTRTAVLKPGRMRVTCDQKLFHSTLVWFFWSWKTARSSVHIGTGCSSVNLVK